MAGAPRRLNRRILGAMRTTIAACLLLTPLVSLAAAPKTALLSDEHLAAIVAEASGSLAKDTVAALAEAAGAVTGIRRAAAHGTAGASERVRSGAVSRRAGDPAPGDLPP
jgi:hypothetical protein